ncbi:hypothetical protein Ae201684P_018316 [Aphanomyces euteiches]|nr:hypothetical protein Ae201684P_018316 [Aphanomyces euteiches]KAH9138415.1 hypothetical protein AeRB84_017253 [Aphanomyces euteiches]
MDGRVAATGPQRAKVGVRIRSLELGDSEHPNPKYAWTWQHGSITQQIFPAPRLSSLEDNQRRKKALPTTYALDNIFPPDVLVQVVYDDVVKDIVSDLLHHRVNGLVAAYGESNSGKSYTLWGQNGIAALMFRDIFVEIQKSYSSSAFKVRVALLEICNEVIHDLLSPLRETSISIDLVGDGYHLHGHINQSVSTLENAIALIEAGMKRKSRHCGHTVLRVTVENRLQSPSLEVIMHVVDLAPSESAQETADIIDQSLLAFGHIVWKMSRSSQSKTAALRIPYGDANLTRLLQPTLGPHASFTLLCTISPSIYNIPETHNTLNFANKAQRMSIWSYNHTSSAEVSIPREDSQLTPVHNITIADSLGSLRTTSDLGNHESVDVNKNALAEDILLHSSTVDALRHR